MTPAPMAMVHAPHCSKPYVVVLCKCGANVACRTCRWGSGGTCKCLRRGERITEPADLLALYADYGIEYPGRKAPAARKRPGAGQEE